VLRKVVSVAGAAMLIEGALFSVMAPLLPHYKHELGLDKAQIGILVGSYGVGLVLSSLPTATLAMRISVARTLTVGLVLMSAASVVVGLAQNVVLLVLARFTQGAAGGVIWSASLAWVSGLAPDDRRGAVLGTLTGTAIAGTLLGPPVGALAAATSPAIVFAALAVINLALPILILRLPAHREMPSNRLRAIVRSPERGAAALALWLVFAPSMAIGLLGVLGPLRLSRLGAGPAAIAVTFVVAAIAQALANPLSGHVSDRRGTRIVMLVALPVEAVFLMLLALPRQAVALAVLVVLGVMMPGAFWVPSALLLTSSAAQAGVSDVYAFALYNVGWAAGQSVGAVGGGALAQLTSDAVPCVVLGVALLSTLPLVSRVTLSSPR
jgi:predicted MFS family arabinose efflux permease